MAGSAKRNRGRNNENDRNNLKRRSDYTDSPDGELVVYRILCPDDAMGNVIGKGGKIINALRNETHAKIKIVDPFPGCENRVINIYCYVKNKHLIDVNEDDDEPLCPAQFALLKTHEAIVNAIENDNEKSPTEEANILVPASQAASIIGRSGTTIKRLRTQTNAEIKINPKDHNDRSHSCAMDFDNFLTITGDTESVRRALYIISAIMFQYAPKEAISLDTTVRDVESGVVIPMDVPAYPASSFYTVADSIMPTASRMSEFSGYPDVSGTYPAYPSAQPIVSKRSELVVKILCPSSKIGRVIGRGGGTIKNIRSGTTARIDVDDGHDENNECVITLISMESTDDMKSAAIESVLAIEEKIHMDDEEKVDIRLLVPAILVGCVIGKGGVIINEMRKSTKADIQISRGQKPLSASPTEELVEVVGSPVNLRTALLQVMMRLREGALKDGDNNNNVSPRPDSFVQTSLSVPPPVRNFSPVAAMDYDRRVETGMNRAPLSSGSLYGYSSLPAAEGVYGSLSSVYAPISSYSSKGFSGLPPYIEMVIPANCVAKVLGKAGSNLENLRKLSGAHIEIVDSKHSRAERIAQISGTTDQKRMAENLIQAFIMAS